MKGHRGVNGRTLKPQTLDVRLATAGAMRVPGDQPIGKTAGSTAIDEVGEVFADSQSISQSRRERLDDFELMYDDHVDAVHAVARMLCGPARADEVTKAAFVAAWRQAGPIDASDRTIRLRLMGVVRQCALDDSRKLTTRSRVSATAQRKTRPRHDPPSLQGEELDDAVDTGQLNLTERTVLALFVIGQCASGDVAQLLGKTQHEVLQDLRSALHRLRTPHLQRRDLDLAVRSAATPPADG